MTEQTKWEPALCDECMERPSVLTIVTGVYSDHNTPLCQKCALDAVKNIDTWNHWVTKGLVVMETGAN
jgi:hypothetical protein